MTLKRRIEKLEKELRSDPILLHFADGSTRVLRGRRDSLLKLLGAVMNENLSPEEAAQVRLIGQSVAAIEPYGARLCELIRIFLEGPAAEGEQV